MNIMKSEVNATAFDIINGGGGRAGGSIKKYLGDVLKRLGLQDYD